ncbi:hypothetical protein Fcan01_25151 [Folsomia candida]|uniref:Uncharacterized protein n=1 Tax=Folsomia candida TaxID=158441 RepID=A0A226D5B8_FOLCA|nr:hypothetical protein Fcan01_25151 [Folsomia candida]
MEMVKISNKATLNGLEYRIGSFVYLGCREEEQLFGRIELIILEDGDCSIIISEMSGERFTSMFLRLKISHVPDETHSEAGISIDTNDILDEKEARERGLCLSPSILKCSSKSSNSHSNQEEIKNKELPPAPVLDSQNCQELLVPSNLVPIKTRFPVRSQIDNQNVSSQAGTAPNLKQIPRQSSSRRNIYGFDINEVLQKSTSLQKIVATKIPENLMIIKADRQLIAAVLIDAVILHHGTRPSKEALEQLAKDLVNYTRRLGIGENYKTDMRCVLEYKLDEAVLQSWDSENENDTVFSRRTYIRRLHQTGQFHLESIMNIMPRLFDTEGMIVQDFNVRHPKLSLVLYNKWPRVSKLLLDYADQSDINYMKKLDVLKGVSDLDDDDKMTLAYCLLPYVLPSCGRKATPASGNTMSTEQQSLSESPQANICGTRKRKIPAASKSPKHFKSIKASDLDCLKSLIIFKSVNTHVADVLDENRNKAPFILALGIPALLKFDAFYVIIDKVAIPCGSRFLVALDTCFKTFTVLGLPFPLESYDHWTFISHGVAGNGSHSPIPPVVQALIGQIMCRI